MGMGNLREQMLKAGLIDKKTKHAAEQEARRKAKEQRALSRSEQEKAERERTARAERELAARREADRLREAERLEQLRAMERMHRLESTIDRNEVQVRAGRRRFYFPGIGAVVGRFDLNERQAHGLEDGDLCIVLHPTDAAQPYKLMDSAGLAELRSIDPAALLFHAPSLRPRDEAPSDARGAVPAGPKDAEPAPAGLPDAGPPGATPASGGPPEDGLPDAGPPGATPASGGPPAAAAQGVEPRAPGAADAGPQASEPGPEEASGSESGTSTST
jgi:uncharacterized protein YaiL (DUF2058 family)